MKKFSSVVLSLLMLFVFAACENTNKPEKYCSNCGEGISKSASFCDSCGASVDGEKNMSNILSDKEDSSNTSSKSSNKENTSEKTNTSSKPNTNNSITSKPVTNTNKTTTSSKPTHTHTYSKKVTSPTCTEKGYTTYTCLCGHTYNDNYTTPSHSYLNYVCSKCGNVDKSHSYEYLLEWLKQNGEASGDHVSIYEYKKNYQYQYGISYNGSADYMYVFFADYCEEGVDADNWYFNIKLNGKNNVFEFYSAYGYKPTLCSSIGTINGKTYTDNSPISCDNYSGDSSVKVDFMESSRLGINVALEFLNNFLEKNVPQITLADLGFEVF